LDNQKPLRSSVLNRNHRHAKGLQAAYLFNDNATKVWDFTRSGNTLDVVNASWVADGMQFDANGEYASLDNSNQLINSEAGTIIICLKSLSVMDDGITRHWFGNRGATVAEGDFFIYKSSFQGRLRFGFGDSSGTHRIGILPTAVPNWTDKTQLSVQWDRSNNIFDSKKLAFNIDGNYVTPDSSIGATAWNSFTVNNLLTVGNDISVLSNEANGIISCVYIYNIVLNETELKNIYNKPYDMFIR
jgi:hypothetical protein